jgi:hypothetical protein
MAAKFPSKVNIGGRVISVKVDVEQSDWGLYHPDRHEITLAPRTVAKMSSLRETLRHEVMHCALDMAGLTYLEDLKSFPEEAVVRAIDHIFHPSWDRIRKQLTP